MPPKLLLADRGEIAVRLMRAATDKVEQPAKQRPYRTEPHKLGLKDGRNLDDIQALLAQIEGEDSR